MGFWFSAYAPLALLFGYLLGSIPFGLLLTQAAGMDDVRKIGSGNIGATNVLRTGRKGLAAATLALDLLKGTVAVLVVHEIVRHAVPLDVSMRAPLMRTRPESESAAAAERVRTTRACHSHLSMRWRSKPIPGHSGARATRVNPESITPASP